MKVQLLIYIFPYLTHIDQFKLDFLLFENSAYNQFKNNKKFNLEKFKKYNYYYFFNQWKKCGHLNTKCSYWKILSQIKQPKYKYLHSINAKTNYFFKKTSYFIFLFHLVVSIILYYQSCQSFYCINFFRDYLNNIFYSIIYYHTIFYNYCQFDDIFF